MQFSFYCAKKKNRESRSRVEMEIKKQKKNIKEENEKKIEYTKKKGVQLQQYIYVHI